MRIAKQAVFALGTMGLMAAGAAWAGNSQAYRCETAKNPEETHIILFGTGSTRITERERADLIWLADRAKGMIDVCVVGQADKQGNEQANHKLAQRRASTVAGLLKAYGVPDEQLVIQARGEAFGDQWLEDFAKQPQDRRVEVRLIR